MTGRYLLLIVVLVFSAACEALSSPTDTPTATPTLSATATDTPVPTDTPLPTDTATPSQTPTSTNTPTDTPIPTDTPVPTNTPLPAPDLGFDNWRMVNIPDQVANGLPGQMVAYLNQYNSENISSLATAMPATDIETLYFASPTNPAQRYAILDMDGSTDDRVYVSPRGNAVAYLVGSGPPDERGLYVLDMSIGLSGRVLPAETLSSRGIFNRPVWHPSGTMLAVVVENGYSLDIMGFEVANSAWRELVRAGSFDMWPSWSPDGRYLAFVSDRAVCSTWIPGEPGACDPDVDPLPDGGHLHVMEIATGEVFQLSDEWATEPPRWVNNRQVVFAVGDQLDLLNPSRTLWVATVADRAAQEIRLEDGPAVQLNLSDAWSVDGNRVIFQNITESSEIVVMRVDGTRLGTVEELSFARFNMRASWSPDGSRIALGGSGGQCPYGIRVLDDSFSLVASGNPPPSMCEPFFSPDGEFITFTGINPRVAGAVDGRVDVYTTNRNGFNAINLTAGLRGQMKLLGWVSP
jgi:Tol biopolymer transport system component